MVLFPHHFAHVVRHAQELADELGGDREIVTLAAWMHDIGSIIHGREDHHITGAEIAETKLKEFDYDGEKIQQVKSCILKHRGSQDIIPETLEEKIVAEADAMSNFDNISGIYKAAFIYEKCEQGEAGEVVRKKLENKWKKLHFRESRRIIEPKYRAIITLLG